MISKMKGQKITIEFDIGEYDPQIIDFLTLLDITSRSKATDKDIENISAEITKNWWVENKDRLLNENSH